MLVYHKKATTKKQKNKIQNKTKPKNNKKKTNTKKNIYVFITIARSIPLLVDY
jgi:hypothetical protein